VESGLLVMPGSTMTFQGPMLVGTTQYTLRIDFSDPSFIKTPIAYLVDDGTTELPDILPHVETGTQNDILKPLCYLDRLGVFLNPHEPANTITAILEAIRQLLEGYSKPDWIAEQVGAEFSSYWVPDLFGYLTTNGTTGFKMCSLVEHTNLAGKVEFEYAIVDDFPHLEWWCQQRNARCADSRIISPAVVIPLDTAPSIYPTMTLPISTWKDFLEWLHRAHPHKEHQLLKAMHALCWEDWPAKSFTIVLDSEESGPFGLRVCLGPSFQDTAKRFGRKLRQGGDTNRFKRIVSNDLYVSQFSKLKVHDARSDFLFERSLTKASLKDKRIALIGCGTVGSFTASLLCRAGAGSGNGELMLFDDDILKTANIGRHLLGIKYVGENKAQAVAHYLRANSSSPLSVSAWNAFLMRYCEDLGNVDVVIDASGDETFSVVLSSTLHGMRRDRKRVPPVIHAWVDGGGAAVRLLIDDGTGACYRCLKKQKLGASPGELEERFPLFNSTASRNSNIRFRCGESFYPFAAGVSSVAAGLIQQSTLNVINGTKQYRLKHASLGPDVRRTKDQNPSALSECPCCSKPTTTT